MASPRTIRLDAVRGVAVVSVIAYHCFTLTVVHHRNDGDVGLGWAPLGAGSIGVDLFFVLSGFLLAGSWASSRKRHRRRIRALADYARRRALRILPAYWLSLIVLVPLVAPGLVESASGLSRLGLLATVQGYLDKPLPGQVNLVYWSLTTEVHFYLVLPLLAWMLARRFGRHTLLPACLVASVGWRLFAPSHLPEGWLVGRLDQFVVGMLAAGLVAAADAGRPGRLVGVLRRRVTGRVLAVLLGVVALHHGARFVVSGAQGYAEWTHPLAGLLIGGILVRVVLDERTPGPTARTLASAGVISYSLYLWHYPILQHGLGFADLPRTGAPVIATVAALGVLVGLAGAVSAVSYRLVERPFLERKAGRDVKTHRTGPPTSVGSPGTRLELARAEG